MQPRSTGVAGACPQSPISDSSTHVLTPAVINETVLAARDYLHSPAGEKDWKQVAGTGARNREVEAPAIAKFLDWDGHRVKEALAEISDIEDEVVEKEVIDRMPSQLT